MSHCRKKRTIVGFILASQNYKTSLQQERLERYRRETTHALAHDLKTPLSIISGYAQNLIEHVQTPKRDQYASHILTNVNRMDKIIRDMLELARLEAADGAIPLGLEDMSLHRISAEIVDRYQPICEEHSITVHLSGDAWVKADPVLMERVIDNFFINALNHAPTGGTIRITITEQEWSCFNSGSPIAADQINAIWQPYIKTDTSRSSTKGTGLGLAISRAILKLHHYPHGARNSEEGVTLWFSYSLIRSDSD